MRFLLALVPAVAVLYFDYSGKDDEMAQLRKGLAQMLISDLGNVDGVQIVERDRLESVLTELKLGESRAFDKTTAAKVGKLLGAQYLVLGGYFDVAGALRVDARVVEVETGKVVKSVGATGKPDDFLGMEQQLAGGLADSLGKLPRKTEAPRPHAARPKPPAKLTTGVAKLYSKALSAIDRGEKVLARETLERVLNQQPDFSLAQGELERLKK